MKLGRERTYPEILRGQESDRSLNPDSPAGDAVDEDEGEVGGSYAAVPLTFSGQFSRHSGR